MHICLSHETALQCWRTIRALGDETVLALLSQPATHPIDGLCVRAKSQELEAVAEQWSLTLPLELAVEEPRFRHRASLAICRMASCPFLQHSFRQIADGLFLPSPEAVFVQMSSVLSDIELLWLANELVSNFSLPGAYGRGVPWSPQLATVQSLAESARTAQSGNKAKMAFALRYAKDHGRSPREIEASIKLALPVARGGLGLDDHLLNPKIALTKEAQRIADRDYCRGDIYFPKLLLDIEYNSNLHHSTDEEMLDDERRRFALVQSGNNVIFLRYPQLDDPDAMFALGKEIAKRYYGKRLRAQGKHYLENRRRLYEIFRQESSVRLR